MWTLLVRGALAVMIVLLAACGGSGADSTSQQEMQRQADLYAIDQIEKDFHQATSKHDIDQMMSLWAPNATFTTSPGQTLTGTDQIRNFWLAAPVFQPENRWVSETPAYKIEITVNGDRGTLYFECHYIDTKTLTRGPDSDILATMKAVTAAEIQVTRLDGRWLIADMIGGSAVLEQ